MEEPVVFKNKSNQTLFGFIHTPENNNVGKYRVGVNILNPGLKNRVAPNRLNVKIARILCENGFYVFRSDPFGIGDSEGQLSEKNENVLDMWGPIQKGIFVNDTICSNDFFIERAKLQGLILIGQCGAGVTALLCGALDNRIDELVLIDTPVRVVTSAIDLQDILAEYEEPHNWMKKGIQTILSPKQMRKLITLDFNWQYYLKTFSHSLRELLTNKRSDDSNEIHDRFNWQMLEAFESFMSRNGKAYFIYAENDFSLKEFSQDFRPNFLDGNNHFTKLCKIDVIENANHIYTEIEWQNELLNNILTWLKTVIN